MAPVPFPIKLWSVVESSDRLITWSSDGKKIVIDENDFNEMVIRYHPTFLRIPTLFSLRRSLRWYNFIGSGKSKGRDGLSLFWHPYFRRDRKDLLPQVTSGNRRTLIKIWTMKFKRTLDELRDKESLFGLEKHLASRQTVPRNVELTEDSLDCDAFDYAEVDDICSLVMGGIQQKSEPLDKLDLQEGKASPSESLCDEATLYQVFCSTPSHPVVRKDDEIDISQNFDAYYPDLQFQILNSCDCSGVDGEGSFQILNFGAELSSCTPMVYAEDISSLFLNSSAETDFWYSSLQEPIGLSNVPEALSVKDSFCDTWIEGETRTYFAL